MGLSHIILYFFFKKMFILYYIWFYLLLFINFFSNYIEKKFFLKNKFYFLRKRDFQYISYLEKLFLVLFYEKNFFSKSISNLNNKKQISEYRKSFYPNINNFFIIKNYFSYKNSNLKLLVKQYNFNKNKIVKCESYNFFFKKKSVFINYLILQNMFFKKYINYNGSLFYKKNNYINIFKFNKIFINNLKKKKFKLVYFNLNIWYDWYNYNFSNFIKILKKHNINKNDINKNKFNKFKNLKIKFFSKNVKNYKKFYYNLIKFKSIFKKIIIFLKIDLNSFFKINLNTVFKKLNLFYIIKFNESSISKYINTFSLKNYNFYYIRKNRIFNKGRYSRNRQLYRTGVYWCLWLNIIMVYGLYFIFYRFSFNFGYFWWGLLILSYSTIFSRILKYNYHNIFYIKKEIFNLIFWYGLIFKNFFFFIKNFFKNYNFKLNIYDKLDKNRYLNFIYSYISKNLEIFYYYYSKNQILFLWQGMEKKDTSFMRYKTIIHWIKELYRLIIT